METHYPFHLRDLPDRVLFPGDAVLDTRCKHSMKLLLSHPELAADLVEALNETDCLAARTALDTVEVFVPWLVDGSDATHAATELLFFVKAWAARHPDLRATLLDPH